MRGAVSRGTLSMLPPAISLRMDASCAAFTDSVEMPSSAARQLGRVGQEESWPVPALSGLLATLTHIPEFGLPPASATRCDGLAAVSFHHRTVREPSWRSM